MKINFIGSLVPGLLVVATLGCGTEELPFAQSMTTSTGLDELLGSERMLSVDAEDVEELSFSDWSAPVNLGPLVNSALADIEVSISRDELSLYVASNRSGDFDIWVSQRASVDDPWGPAQNLGSPINTSARDQGMFLTQDGHRLYFFSDRPGEPGDTDLYVSRRRDKGNDFDWQTAVNLGSAVNSNRNENLPIVFEADLTGTTTLYFTSNRLGGIGGTDIYASTLQPDETFGPAAPVAEFNSTRRDATVAIRRDGLEMILASDREGSLGGPGSFDLWVTTRATTSDPWSAPENLGPVVNSVEGGESRGSLSFDGTSLYIISDRTGSNGNLDVWVSTRSRLRHPD